MGKETGKVQLSFERVHAVFFAYPVTNKRNDYLIIECN